jgi:hypothetical protein
MDIYKLKDLSTEERRSVLEGESIGEEEQSYMRPLSDQELADMKTEFSSAAIDKAVVEEEFKQVKDQYKSKLKPYNESIVRAMAAIKNRAIWTSGVVFKLPDYDNKMIHIVNADGVVINSRMMKPEERQFRIQHNQKSA